MFCIFRFSMTLILRYANNSNKKAIVAVLSAAFNVLPCSESLNMVCSSKWTFSIYCFTIFFSSANNLINWNNGTHITCEFLSAHQIISSTSFSLKDLFLNLFLLFFASAFNVLFCCIDDIFQWFFRHYLLILNPLTRTATKNTKQNKG